MASLFPVSFLAAAADGRVLGRRTRSRMLSFWLQHNTDRSWWSCHHQSFRSFTQQEEPHGAGGAGGGGGVRFLTA